VIGRRSLLAFAIVAFAFAGACRRDTGWPPSPASVTLGEDACADCRMIVSDDRFGAQLHNRSGDVAHFDDTGCLRAFVSQRPFEIEGVFVRSFRSRAWVRGDRAWVVESRAFPSPMDHAVAAFDDEASARDEASRHPDGKARSLVEYLSSSSLVSGGL
jgi:copper chaperone NosL